MIICLCLHLNLGTIDYKCNLDKDLFEYAKSTYGRLLRYAVQNLKSMHIVLWRRIHFSNLEKSGCNGPFKFIGVDMENYYTAII